MLVWLGLMFFCKFGLKEILVEWVVGLDGILFRGGRLLLVFDVIGGGGVLVMVLGLWFW